MEHADVGTDVFAGDVTENASANVIGPIESILIRGIRFVLDVSILFISVVLAITLRVP